MYIQVSELRYSKKFLIKRKKRKPNDDIIQEINKELQSIYVEIICFKKKVRLEGSN